MPRRKGDDLDDFIVPDDEVEESEDSDAEEPLSDDDYMKDLKSISAPEDASGEANEIKRPRSH